MVTCTIQEGGGYAGNDIRYEPSTSYADCCYQCNNEPKCKAWTWENRDPQLCWLHNSTSMPTYSYVGFVRGLKESKKTVSQ